ncbi:lysyl-tRNA synthetase [Spiroplasma sabaudiense Ar-1343]|uniref:Lysine--tRNA ligase n=1 Tax=Spiroplasma sabaudiense Ar-1343 TaxID=1276257 RepID=W6A962_9MOLU|nr:lysine--tRNA ligase [Spiroplasma sabaudiense]AHI53430.1 lysyl-tRNA synthetase [Spiroplasma sabaudiense Ar-1343]
MKDKFERAFTEQEQVRREKYKKLAHENRDPFKVTKFSRTTTIQEAIEKFSSFTKEDLLNLKQENLKIAGRIRLFREAGKKAIFANIQDQESNIQIYARQDELGDSEFEYFRDLDLGDIIGLEGTLMKTDHGELTLRVKKYTLLSKSLRPLPDKHSGIADIEEKYRRRYVDLIMNPETKKTFQARTKIIRKIQDILDNKGYMEVETPILHTINGGAAAKPFITHYNALDREFYLRIATELHLKRLIVGGFEGVYEIGRIFRNEGMDTRHNPEFTSIELYVAYEDMDFLMDLTENIFKECSLLIQEKTNIEYGGHKLELGKKWKRWHMVDAIKEITGIDFWKQMTYAEATKIAKQKGIQVEKHHLSVGHIINLFFEEFVEDKIIEPTFIYGHPKEISPLSKTNNQDSRFTDRFELFIIGREYANAFAELNNPIDQYERFVDQIKEADAGNDEATGMDIDFIEALEYGFPPTAGIGIGIDRLVMLLTNSESIKDVLLFPQMKPRS